MSAPVETLLLEIGERVEQLMREQDLRQSDVFLRSNGAVRPETVSRVLRARDHRLSTLIEIADALGCDLKIELRQKAITAASVQA